MFGASFKHIGDEQTPLGSPTTFVVFANKGYGDGCSSICLVHLLGKSFPVIQGAQILGATLALHVRKHRRCSVKYCQLTKAMAGSLSCPRGYYLDTCVRPELVANQSRAKYKYTKGIGEC